MNVSFNMAGDREKEKDQFRPSANAIMLFLCVAALSLWLWLYSDLLAIFTGMVGLVTVLVGAMTRLQGVMSEARRKRYSDALDAFLFQNAIAAFVFGVLLAAILFVGFVCIKPMTLRASGSSVAETVTVTLHWDGSGKQQIKRIRAEPNVPQRLPILRPQFGGPDRAILRARQLPKLERDLRPLSGVEVIFPVDFWSQPALVMRASPALIATLWENKPVLKIARAAEYGTDEACDVQDKYLGEPAWLGTGGLALRVDRTAIETWRDQVSVHGARAGIPDLEKRFMVSPIAAECAKTLSAGDVITWSLVSRGTSQKVLREGRIEITGREPYPIEVVLE